MSSSRCIINGKQKFHNKTKKDYKFINELVIILKHWKNTQEAEGTSFEN